MTAFRALFAFLLMLSVTACAAVPQEDARDLSVMKPVSPVDPTIASKASGPVFYLTDRVLIGDSNKSPAIFGPTWSNTLSCGIEQVTIPVNEKPQSGDGPWKTTPVSNWPMSPSLEPKEIAAMPVPPAGNPPAIGPLACDQSGGPAKAIAQAILVSAEQAHCDHVLLFVHGFNNAYEDALTTAAQLAHDSNWQCPVVAFDWSSAGALVQYVDDIEHSSYAQLRLAEFIGALSDTEALHLDIVAHSMGCRLTSATLSALERRARPAKPGFIDQLVFAAPDVGLQDFKLLESDAQRLANRVTVYASTGDVAVEASYFVHGEQERAGNNPPKLEAWRQGINVPLDVLDASKSTGDVYGHGYFTRSQMAAIDVARVLHGETVEQRLADEPRSLLCFDTPNSSKPCSRDTIKPYYRVYPDPGDESWWSWFAKHLWK